jgi:hypothetical protein
MQSDQFRILSNKDFTAFVHAYSEACRDKLEPVRPSEKSSDSAVCDLDAGIFDVEETIFAMIRIDRHVAMGSLCRVFERNGRKVRVRDIFSDRLTTWLFFQDPLKAARRWLKTVGHLPPIISLAGPYVQQIWPYPPRTVGRGVIMIGCFRTTAEAKALHSHEIEQIKRMGLYVSDRPIDDTWRNYFLPPAALLKTSLQQT